MKEGVRTVAVEAPAIGAQSAPNISKIMDAVRPHINGSFRDGFDSGVEVCTTILEGLAKLHADKGMAPAAGALRNAAAVLAEGKAEWRDQIMPLLPEPVRSEATIAADGQGNGTNP